MKRKKRRCGRGHDLSDPKNVIPQHAGLGECRVCKRLNNQLARDRRTVRIVCTECGKPKRKDKSRMCDPCRWRHAVRRAQERATEHDIERTLQKAVALESAPPWEKREAAAVREREREVHLRRLAARDAMRDIAADG